MQATQLVNLHDVEEYQKSRNLVQSDQVTPYVRWLSRFLTGPGSDPGLSHEDALRAFLEQLERRGDVPEWQFRPRWIRPWMRRADLCACAITRCPQSRPISPGWHNIVISCG